MITTQQHLNEEPEDIHGTVLVALNHMSNMTDDLYSMLGEGIEITDDEHDAILNAYDLISEIHDKYDDHYEMPSYSYDPEDWDDINVSEALEESVSTFNLEKGIIDPFRLEVKGKTAFQLTKILDKILPSLRGANEYENEVDFSKINDRNTASKALSKYFSTNEESEYLEEGTAWRMMIKTLTDLGFKKTEPSKDTWQPITPKRLVDHMFGIPMRAGKWADTFFVIFGDDDKPYCIIDSDGKTQYTDLGKALADLKKRAKVNESLTEAAKKFKFNPGKHEVQVSSKRGDDGKFSITVVDKETNSKVLHRMRHELSMAKEGGDANTAGSRVIDAKRVLSSLKEDTELNEGSQQLITILKELGFTKRKEYSSPKKIKLVYVRPGSNKNPEIYVGEYENESKPYFITHADGKESYKNIEDFIAGIKEIVKSSTNEDTLDENTNMIILSENTLMVENDDSIRIKNIMESICEDTSISINENDEELVFDTKEQCSEASVMLKQYFEILGEQYEIVDLNTISEEFDENKFRRLAIAGLVSDTDVAKIIRAMKDLQAGKTLDAAKKNLIASTFLNLVGLVTGDTSVFSKIQTAVKNESMNEEIDKAGVSKAIEIVKKNIAPSTVVGTEINTKDPKYPFVLLKINKHKDQKPFVNKTAKEIKAANVKGFRSLLNNGDEIYLYMG